MADQQAPESKEVRRAQEQRIIRRSTLISLVGGVIFLGLGYLLYKAMPSPYEEIKESAILRAEATVSMAVLQYNADGSWGALDHTPNEGEKVAFKISTTQPIHVALFVEANHTEKHLVFDYLRIPPGENKILKVGNQPYIYQVGKGEEHVVFCMVVVTDPDKLPTALADVLPKVHLDDLPKEHCASW